MEKKGSLKGLTIAIVGDILHSRVARSDINAFKKMGAKVILCGPPTLVPDYFNQYDVEISYNFDDTIKKVDVINMLRIQKVRQNGAFFPSTREYHKNFALTEARLQKCKNDIIVMHPGPVNRGVEVSNEIIDSPNFIMNEQVTNGVAVRMAIFYLLAGGAPFEENEVQ
jgi:aspartate carbamoyltransferase catalytic subunit